MFAGFTEPPLIGSEAEKSAQRYYRSCLQYSKAVYTTGPDKALLDLMKLIGGFSDNDEIYMHYFKKKEWDFQAAFETVQNMLNVDVFFRWRMHWLSSTTTGNFKNPDRYIIKVRNLLFIWRSSIDDSLRF